VANGFRIITITPKKYIPLHLSVVRYRTLVSFDGQPLTCCGYKKIGRLIQPYPSRRRWGKNRLRQLWNCGRILKVDTPGHLLWDVG